MRSVRHGSGRELLLPSAACGVTARSEPRVVALKGNGHATDDGVDVGPLLKQGSFRMNCAIPAPTRAADARQTTVAWTPPRQQLRNRRGGFAALHRPPRRSAPGRRAANRDYKAVFERSDLSAAPRWIGYVSCEWVEARAGAWTRVQVSL
jgi:hypothetical protein